MKRCSLMLLTALVFSATPVVVGQSPVAAAGTCIANFNNCKVGDVGQGGGIVYYDAGSPQWWGQFLEAKTTSNPAGGIWGTAGAIGGVSSVAMKQLGMGSSSSSLMLKDASSVVTRLKDTAFSNGFHLPSKDELDALYNYWKISGDTRLNYKAAPMWSSTEASATFAWYQLFQDGTQFTDANGIIKDPKTTKAITQNKAFLKSPKHKGSDFEPTPFEVIGVRAFGTKSGQLAPPTNEVRATTSNDKCSNGGAATVCNIGDIGPGGGIVFYDAGKEEYWGRYLEIAPKSCEGERYPWRPADNDKTVYTAQGDQTAAELRVLAKGMGMGKVNTRIITRALGAGKYAAKYAEDSECNGRDDWFLPSKDELDTAYNRLAQNRVGSKDTPIGGFNKGYYWTSSDYNNATAWSQYFMDGQQFDRVQKMDGNRTPPTPFRVRAIRAFGTNTVVLPCAQGGSCKIGDTGPGGGKVFYVAPDFFMVNGKSARYLEASPQDSQGAWCKQASNCQRLTRLAVARDSGAVNTSQILNSEGVLPDVGELIKQGVNGKFDWYVPSIDELIKLNRQRDMVGGFRWGFYWSSSFVNGGMLGFGLKMHRGNAADEVLFRWEPAGIRLIRAFG
jgi:hypothetical protein